MYRPTDYNVEGYHSVRLPVMKFITKDGKVGIVQSLYTHPDNGTVFDADILFEDGIKSWRGSGLMLGKFLIDEGLTS